MGSGAGSSLGGAWICSILVRATIATVPATDRPTWIAALPSPLPDWPHIAVSVVNTASIRMSGSNSRSVASRWVRLGPLLHELSLVEPDHGPGQFRSLGAQCTRDAQFSHRYYFLKHKTRIVNGETDATNIQVAALLHDAANWPTGAILRPACDGAWGRCYSIWPSVGT
ncbi:MAG: hypothetical protein QOG25_3115 [Acetobacteraceae bacterium]|nr:hypothetical protein [Acetobacteraceae bacterium]